jgi:hypothetical protein
MNTAQGYMLYVDGKPTKVGMSLQEAQSMAAQFIDKNVPLQIESHVAPASGSLWVYDHSLTSWVEQR